MPIPFVGGDAVAAGHLTRAQLRHRFRPIFHGIYVPRLHQPTLRERIDGAVLAAPSAVISGVAASALHGARWVDDDVPVELVGACRRQRGLVVRDETLAAGEVVEVDGIRVTTPARTAFDLARHLARGSAVARIDALLNARPFAVGDVELLAKVHRGVRGLTRLRAALPVVDGGAESPKETWLRLLFVDAGLPKPTTQVVIRTESGRYIRRIDMCWEQFKVGAEYDGQQHLTERSQYTKDVWANRELQRLNWHVIHVIKEDRGADIVAHARDTLLSRGWSGLPA
ncbi:hypothetical protein [Mycolicibacterium sp. YH-1]|uniref:hypothetical protein n=1 Tax=Mycolicibacterium sp. YH-1 TaxID=2908837 RepID=UPI001F4BEF6F|nr:hypothetical protein [Mycolicibacterium sp. YH-1]UNB51441.1 hypothetical protein L0M16_26520 [Mycolicibacterium sp. YH-1]